MTLLSLIKKKGHHPRPDPKLSALRTQSSHFRSALKVVFIHEKPPQAMLGLR